MKPPITWSDILDQPRSSPTKKELLIINNKFTNNKDNVFRIYFVNEPPFRLCLQSHSRPKMVSYKFSVVKDNEEPKKFVFEKLQSQFLEFDAISLSTFEKLLSTLKPHYVLEDRKQVKELIKILVSKVEKKEELAEEIILTHSPTAVSYWVLAYLLSYVGNDLVEKHLDLLQWKIVKTYSTAALISAGQAMCINYPRLIDVDNFKDLCVKLFFELAENEESYYYNIKIYFIPLAAGLEYGLRIFKTELVSTQSLSDDVRNFLTYDILKEEARRDSSCIPRQFKGVLRKNYKILLDIISNVPSKKYEYNHAQILFFVACLEENVFNRPSIKYFLSNLCVQIFYKKEKINYITFIKETIMDPIKRNTSNMTLKTSLFVYKTLMECLYGSLDTKYSLQGNEKNAGCFVRDELQKHGTTFGEEFDVKLMTPLIETEDSDALFYILTLVDDKVVRNIELKQVYFDLMHESNDIFIDANVGHIIRIILIKTCSNLDERVEFLNKLAKCCIPHIETYLEGFEGVTKGPIACIKALSTAIDTVNISNLQKNYIKRVWKIIDSGLNKLASFLGDEINRSQDMLKVCEKVINQIAELMLIVISQKKVNEIKDMTQQLFTYGELLISCNMRFTVAKCSEYFTKIVSLVDKCDYFSLEKYYKHKLKTIEAFVGNCNWLRRSIQLRTVMASIAKGLLGENKLKFIEEAISYFMVIPKSLNDASSEFIATKLNCLDEFFNECSFKLYVSKYVPQALVISIYASNSFKFKIRNSAMTLYSTLKNKVSSYVGPALSSNISGLATISKSFEMLMRLFHSDSGTEIYKDVLYDLVESLYQDYYTPQVLAYNLLHRTNNWRENIFWLNIFRATFMKDKCYRYSPIEFNKNGLFFEMDRFTQILDVLKNTINWYEVRGLKLMIHEYWYYYVKEVEIVTNFLGNDKMYTFEVIYKNDVILFEQVLKNILHADKINNFTKVYTLEQVIIAHFLYREDFFEAFFKASCTFVLQNQPNVSEILLKCIIYGFKRHQTVIYNKKLNFEIKPCRKKIEESTNYAAVTSVIYFHMENVTYFKHVQKDLILKQFYSPNNEIIGVAFYSLFNFEPVEILLCALYIVCLTDHEQYPTILPNVTVAITLKPIYSFTEFILQVFTTDFLNKKGIDALNFFSIFEDRLKIFESKDGILENQCCFLKTSYQSLKAKLLNFYT